MRWFLPSLLSLVLALSAAGQSLTIGNDVTPGPPDSGLTSPRTTIDLANPASASGTVTSVKYAWSTAACANALKIKFFRRTGDSFTMTEERGPFNSGLVETITLVPPVSVQQGDLIGIARLTNCGTPRASSVASDGFLVYAGDVTGTVTYAEAFGRAMSSLALYGNGTATDAVAGVITVVGATAGGFGSNWKTAVQLFNPNSVGTLSGKIVFRPMAAIAPSASLGYTLGPGELKAYEDVVTAMGQSGLGTLDVIVPAGQGEPIIVSRVYNDAGASGTSGLSQELIPRNLTLKGLTRILRLGNIGFLFTPQHPDLTRFNIGVRTLDSGATLEVTLTNASGTTLRTVTRSYPPNWFIQTDSATFLSGAIAGNESIRILVRSGSAIIYGSTNDNVTNDPSVQFATIVFSTS